MDGDGEAEGRRCHDCLISLARCHPSHEMMRRRDAILEDVLPRFSPDPLLSALVNLLALNSSPAPGRRDESAAVDLRLRALGRSACLLSFPCRSLAIARSLLSLGSSCGAVLLGVFYSAVSYRYTVQYEQGLCAWLCLTPVAGAAFLSVCGAALFLVSLIVLRRDRVVGGFARAVRRPA